MAGYIWWWLDFTAGCEAFGLVKEVFDEMMGWLEVEEDKGPEVWLMTIMDLFGSVGLWLAVWVLVDLEVYLDWVIGVFGSPKYWSSILADW